MHFVDADGVITRPLAIIKAFAEGESAFMKCGSDGQGVLLLVRRREIIVGAWEGEQGREATPPIFFASVRKRMSANELSQNFAERFVISVRKLLKRRHLDARNVDLLQDKELGEVYGDFTPNYTIKLYIVK